MSCKFVFITFEKSSYPAVTNMNPREGLSLTRSWQTLLWVCRKLRPQESSLLMAASRFLLAAQRDTARC